MPILLNDSDCYRYPIIERTMLLNTYFREDFVSILEKKIDIISKF